MVLAQDTDVLLLDEPTTFLDLHHQLQVMEIVETLRDESDITVVVVLHDIEQAARHADRIVALDDGEIHGYGTPTEIVTEELLATVFEIEAAVDVVDQARGSRRFAPFRLPIRSPFRHDWSLVLSAVYRSRLDETDGPRLESGHPVADRWDCCNDLPVKPRSACGFADNDLQQSL